jgi:hypothetical protein
MKFDLRFDRHGGSCCGMAHIYNFPLNPILIQQAITNLNENFKTKNKRIKNIGNIIRFAIGKYPDRDIGIRYQITLTEAQNKILSPVLIKTNWTIVDTFINMNTENRIYVYHTYGKYTYHKAMNRFNGAINND